MKITREVFEGMSIDRLYNVVFGDVKDFFRFFHIFNIDENEFTSIIKQIIELTKNTYSSNYDYGDYIKLCLCQYIRERLAKQDADKNELIIKMFNINDEITTLEEAISVLELFNGVTQGISFDEFVVIISKLLSCDCIYSRSLTFIFEEKREQIISGDVDKIGVSYKLIPYIDYYCMYNNIETEEPKITADFVIRQSPDTKLYLKTIENTPTLSIADENECLRLIHNNYDKEALKRIMNSKKAFVAGIAKRYADISSSFLDLTTIGSKTLRDIVCNVVIPNKKTLSQFSTWRISFFISKEVEETTKKPTIPNNLLDPPKPEIILPIIERKTKKIYRPPLPKKPRTLCEALGCTYEQLEELLPRIEERIKPEKIEKLRQRYGEKLDDFFPMKGEIRKKEIDPLLRVLRRMLQDPEYGRKGKAAKPLTELLGCTTEQLNFFVSKLRQDKIELLKNRYGENFDEVFPMNNKQIVSEIIQIVRTLKKISKTPDYTPKNTKRLYELLKCSYEESIALVNNLDANKIEILKERYGPNLDTIKKMTPKRRKEVLNPILVELKKMRKPKKTTTRCSKTLCELLNCSYDQLDIITKKLTIDEMEKLKGRYGEKLDEVIPMDKKTRIDKILPVIKVLRKILKNPNAERKINGSLKLNVLLNCSLEQTQRLVSKLDKDSQEKIYKKYGINLDEILPVSAEERRNEIAPIIKKLKLMNKNPNYGKCKAKKLYELIDCSPEQLKTLISQLNQKHIEIMRERYGDNYDEVFPMKSDKIRRKVAPVLYILRQKLINPNYGTREPKKICDLLGCSFEKLSTILSCLNQDDLIKLKQRYGDDFNEVIPMKSEIVRKTIYPIVRMLKKKLANPNYGRRQAKPLTELLGYTLEVVTIAASKLKPEKLKKLKERYGPNLDQVIPMQNSQTQLEIYSIVKSLKKKIEKPNNGPKPLTELVGCPLEKLIELSIKLDPKKLENLKKRYGENLDTIIPLNDKKVYQEVWGTIAKLRNMLKKPNISKCKAQTLCKVLKCYSKKLTIILSYLDHDELETLKRRYGENFDTVLPMKSDEVRRDITPIVNKLRYIRNHPNYKKRGKQLKKSANYIETIKELRAKPSTKDFICSSIEIKNKSLAFMLLGLPINEGDRLEDPISPEELSLRENIDLEELSRMIDLIAKNVLKREPRNLYLTRKSQQKKNKQIGEKLVKVPVSGKKKD